MMGLRSVWEWCWLVVYVRLCSKAFRIIFLFHISMMMITKPPRRKTTSKDEREKMFFFFLCILYFRKNEIYENKPTFEKSSKHRRLKTKESSRILLRLRFSFVLHIFLLNIFFFSFNSSLEICFQIFSNFSVQNCLSPCSLYLLLMVFHSFSTRTQKGKIHMKITDGRSGS